MLVGARVFTVLLQLGLSLPPWHFVSRAICGLCRYARDGPLPTRQGYRIYYQRTDPLPTGLRRAVVAGIYEPEYLVALAQLVRPGDTVVDIGAHEGYITCWLAQCVGPRGRVVAVEPNPENLGYLRRNVDLNDYGHVDI
jgi:protein-L-isoaspartate O-methyltransferase